MDSVAQQQLLTCAVRLKDSLEEILVRLNFCPVKCCTISQWNNSCLGLNKMWQDKEWEINYIPLFIEPYCHFSPHTERQRGEGGRDRETTTRAGEDKTVTDRSHSRTNSHGASQQTIAKELSSDV